MSVDIYYGVHPHLDRGEFRADAILTEIEVNKQYPDKDVVPLYKGWVHVLADNFMLAGVLRFIGKKMKNANVLISLNEQDFGETITEVVPD